MSEPLIDLVDVSYTYPGAVPVDALQPVTLEIHPGDRLAIVGPSGSGKSTLLQILGLLSRPTGGRYYLAGRDVTGMEEARRSDLRGSFIGFVFQAFHLMSHRDVTSNVALPLRYSPVDHSEDERAEMVGDALERVGLAHRAHHHCNELSGGECQRVAIARAMVTRPRLILADEPTGNLDSSTGSQIVESLFAAAGDGATLVVITHDHDVARRFDRQLHIRDGIVTEVDRG